MGHVLFTLLDSLPLPNVFPAWRPRAVVISHTCTGVFLIVEKYFLCPVLSLWKSTFKMVTNDPTSCSHPCEIPSSVVPGGGLCDRCYMAEDIVCHFWSWVIKDYNFHLGAWLYLSFSRISHSGESRLPCFEQFCGEDHVVRSSGLWSTAVRSGGYQQVSWEVGPLAQVNLQRAAAPGDNWTVTAWETLSQNLWAKPFPETVR